MLTEYLWYGFFGVTGAIGIFALVMLIGYGFFFLNQRHRSRILRRRDEERAYWEEIERMEEYNRVHYGE